MSSVHNKAQDEDRTAENEIDKVHPTHWQADKNDVKSQEELHAADSENGAHHASSDTGESTPPQSHGAGIEAEPPEKFTGLHVTPRSKYAAGIPAVVQSMRHVWGEMGVYRGSRALLALNQKGGIDCPSCAWPEPDGSRHIAEFCESGAKAIAWEGDRDRITAEFFKQWSVAELSQKSDYWLGMQGRLTEPMVLRDGATHYEPISWDAAFDLLARELNSLATPDDAIFYTSGRTSNEAAFLYQLFVRQFGTNNMPDCSNMCHESSGSALTPTIGIGKGTVTIGDFEHAQLIILIGQNPGTNHPRMLTTLERAKAHGAKIIAINPLPEPGLLRFKNPQEVSGVLGSGIVLADQFLQVRLSGDAALLKGLAKFLLEQDDAKPGSALKHEFIAAHTDGFGDLSKDLRLLSWSIIEEQSGISRQQIAEAGIAIKNADRIITCWAMGLTQQKTAVSVIQDIVNLHLLRGAIGKQGAGVCPVRGHSNVQGDRTMGVWERPREEFLNKLRDVCGFEPPRLSGLDTVESIKAMHAGAPKIFFAMGGNFLSATPDTNFTADGLRKCRLTAQVSIKLNRSHLVTGRQALILPCLGRSEIDIQIAGPQLVSTENSMGVVETSQGRFKPASDQLLSEPMIVARLARATLGGRSSTDWLALAGNYDLIRDLIARVIPGCEDYNKRVRKPGGFYLPNKAREGKFVTKTDRANFTVSPLPDLKLEPGQLVMTTIRTHDQFNTTIYGLDDRYRGIHNERRVVLMNADDINDRNLTGGSVVDLTSYHNGTTRVARQFIVVPYDIPRGCVASYFPEANALVPIDSVAEKSNTPTSKYVVIRVAPTTGPVTKIDYNRAM